MSYVPFLSSNIGTALVHCSSLLLFIQKFHLSTGSSFILVLRNSKCTKCPINFGFFFFCSMCRSLLKFETQTSLFGGNSFRSLRRCLILWICLSLAVSSQSSMEILPLLIHCHCFVVSSLCCFLFQCKKYAEFPLRYCKCSLLGVDSITSNWLQVSFDRVFQESKVLKNEVSMISESAKDSRLMVGYFLLLSLPDQRGGPCLNFWVRLDIVVFFQSL